MSGAAISGGTNAAIQYHAGDVQWSGIGGVFDAAGDGAMFGLLGSGAALATCSTSVAGGVAKEAAEVIATKVNYSSIKSPSQK